MRSIIILDIFIGTIFIIWATYSIFHKKDEDSRSQKFYRSAFTYILEVEGGYINDPKDPGGETKYGISKNAFPKLVIKNLTRSDAKKLFHTHYWLPCYDDSMSFKIALISFDSCVHLGVGEGVKILQKSLKVSIDGKIGRKTRIALNTINQEELSLRMLASRMKSYQKTINYNIYGGAWTKRLFKLAFYSHNSSGKIQNSQTSISSL